MVGQLNTFSALMNYRAILKRVEYGLCGTLGIIALLTIADGLRVAGLNTPLWGGLAPAVMRQLKDTCECRE